MYRAVEYVTWFSFRVVLVRVIVDVLWFMFHLSLMILQHSKTRTVSSVCVLWNFLSMIGNDIIGVIVDVFKIRRLIHRKPPFLSTPPALNALACGKPFRISA